MHPLISRLVRLGPEARQRAITLLILVIAAVMMLAGAGSGLIKTYENLAKADRLAAVSLIMSGVPDTATPVTFLDVDDATRRAWSAEGGTPHAALAELIGLAQRNQAEAVLVDFDLSPERPGTLADGHLSAVLKSWPADGPQLLLVRRIMFTQGDGPDQTALIAAGAAATPYDGDVAGKPNITWVAALNESSNGTPVKRIRLWQVVCDGAAGTAYPSPALAVAAHVAENGKYRSALEQFLGQQATEGCGGTASFHSDWPPVRSQMAMLPYLFGDARNAGAQLRVTREGRETILMRRIGAGQLVRHDAGKADVMGEIDADPFAGRIVVIGGSYTGSGDVHDTPFGWMPGAMILANSVAQSHAIVHASPLPSGVINFLSMGLFLIFAAFARYLVPIAALIGIGLVSLFCLFVVTRLSDFASGFDMLAVALSGFALFKFVDMLARFALDIPKRGWRAVLKT